jgi:hypothetical protein
MATGPWITRITRRLFESFYLERTSVSVPEVCTSITSKPLVSECVSLLDRALSYKGNAVWVLGSSLPDSVPMYGNLQALHTIQNVDNYLVAFTDLQHKHEFILSTAKI